MANVWNKIDSGLATIYANFLQVRDLGAANVARVDPVVAGGSKLLVSLRFSGDIASVENAGFETRWTDGEGWAMGVLRLEDLQRIAELDNVITIKYGNKLKLNLDFSIPNIKANQVWTLGANGAFSGVTGTGILIGVIDTGVDIRHQFLWKQTTPQNETRILRIWDMGLEAKGVADHPGQTPIPKAPDLNLIHGGAGGTYGVEYTNAHINAVIQDKSGKKKIRHKDCHGHGTFVASIAAGDGRPKFKHIGVAPKAELIIVKMLILEKEPKVGAVEVPINQKIMDAVIYIRKVADQLAKPVAINFSLGEDQCPHDGFTELESWLANEFRSSASAGKIFVAAAGNEAAQRRHAVLTFTSPNQEIEVPFAVTEKRAILQIQGFCSRKLPDPGRLYIEFYYQIGSTLTFTLQPPGGAIITGPALGTPLANHPFKGRNIMLSHSVARDVQVNNTIIERNRITIQIEPTQKQRLHVKGEYRVKLKANAPVVVHGWCGPVDFEVPDLAIGLREGTLPAGVTQEDKFLIGQPAGADNILTVANYNPDPDDPNEVVDATSSRGPLIRFSGQPPIVQPKPDIGAPGVEIEAARSSDGIIPGPTKTSVISAPLAGTSSSTPHVAGTVALMLEKQKTLTPSQALAKLKANAVQVSPPAPDDIGGGRLDAKKTVDNTP